MTDYLEDTFDVNDAEFVACYDEAPLWSAMFGLLLLEHVPLRPDLTVLDVGCGTGFPLLELAERLGPTCKVCGLDTWQAAAARARRKIAHRGIGNVEVVDGDATAMPFQDDTFDLVVSSLGVNNFADPAAAFGQCARVAGRGAVLALATNLRGHMDEVHEVYDETLRQLGMQELIEPLRAHVRRRTTVVEICGWMERAGFAVRKIYRDARHLRFLDGSAVLRHSFIRIGFLPAWRDVVPAKRRREVFARLEANLNAIAQQQGELALTVPMAYIEAERLA